MPCLVEQVRNAVNLTEQTKDELSQDLEQVRTNIAGLSIGQVSMEGRIAESEEAVDSLEEYSSELLFQICLLQLGIDDE